MMTGTNHNIKARTRTSVDGISCYLVYVVVTASIRSWILTPASGSTGPAAKMQDHLPYSILLRSLLKQGFESANLASYDGHHLPVSLEWPGKPEILISR